MGQGFTLSLVGGVGPEQMVPDGTLHFREEGLDLLAVLLSIGSLKDEREGYEEVVCHASCRYHRW